MGAKNKIKIGDDVDVEIWNSEKRKSEFFPAKIYGLRSATDRDFRIDVVLDNGVEIEGCAPECIIPVT